MRQVVADIAVISAGTAGLAAAVSAAEFGAKVSVFEKKNQIGGTSNIARAIFAVESRLQKQKNFTFSKDEAFKLHMEHTHWQVDARLVRVHIEKSADTIAWLERMGVKFNGPSAYYPGSYFTEHTIANEGNIPGNTSAVSKALTKKAEELGITFFLKTPVKKIVKEDGRISGIIALDENGNEIRANASAVIIATGGFGSNPEWVRKYIGIDPNLIHMKMPGGEGIEMAWEVGAGRTPMTLHINDQIEGVPRNTHIVWGSFRQPNLMVNLLGERFVNEELVTAATYMGNALLRQKKACAFMIYDEDTRVSDSQSVAGPPMGPAGPGNMTFEDEMARLLEKNPDAVIVAGSLEELANKAGIEPDNLRQTVDEYNRCCTAGYDNLFNKNRLYLKQIKTPEFYAAKYVPGAFGTLGGIKINHRTEVITDEFEVIPGLFAAGSDANSIYGDSYTIVMPGNTMGFAINSGRIAGENAALFIKSVR